MNYRESKIKEKGENKKSNKTARLYKDKNARVKNALSFSVPKKTKLA